MAAIDQFKEAIEIDGLEYAVIHYSNWDELEAEEPAIWEEIQAMKSAYYNLERML